MIEEDRDFKKFCYFCKKEFSVTEISEYTADGKAICPYCKVDAVIDDKITPWILNSLYKYWFTED